MCVVRSWSLQSSAEIILFLAGCSRGSLTLTASHLSF